MNWNQRTVAGVLLAASLAFSGAVHALMINNAESITYAKETLLKATANVTEASDDDDSTTYYNITREHALNAAADVAGNSGDTFIVSYSLNGLVFTNTSVPTSPVGGLVGYGGLAGDSYLTYRGTLSANLLSTADVNLSAATFAVSAEGGTITRTVTNQTAADLGLPKVPTSKTRTVSVLVKPALKETVISQPALVAKAAQGFRNFGMTGSTATLTGKLGTIELGVMGMAVDTSVTPNVPATWYKHSQNDEDVDALTDIAPADESSPYDNNGMVAGATSFVDKIGFSTDTTASPTDCSSVTDNVRYPSTHTTKAGEFMSLNLDGYTSKMALCIMVDGETMMTEGEYTVTTMYKGLANAAFPPAGGTHTIGVIERDGTTVHIPYLTVHESYNQRLVLRNRSSREVTYNVMFHTEDGITADTTAMASGDLAANTVKTMRVQEMVTITGGARTSATVTSDAAKGMLDVATTLVNRTDGSTDTETHMAQ